MAATTGVPPVKQALVRALRENLALKAMVGSDGINEGAEPRNGTFPYIIYSVISSRREWDATGMMLITDVDVWSVSQDQVEAHNLDQLVAEALEDKVLEYEPETGQTSMACRRIGDLSSVDLDGSGERVYEVCGVYRIFSDQQRTA